MALYLDKPLELKEKLKNSIDFISRINPSLPNVKIGILNIMPTLEDTERQLMIALDNPVVQIDLDFIYLDTKTADLDKVDYYKKYYHSFSEIDRKSVV